MKSGLKIRRRKRRERGTYEFKDGRHEVAGLMLIRPVAVTRRQTQVRKESYNLFATLSKWFVGRASSEFGPARH